MKGLEGGGVVSLRGVGAMEVAVERGFVVGVVGGLRAVGGSREAARREREGEEGGFGAGAGGIGLGEEDDGMDF
jgi:GINS complex subunit 2